MRTQLKTCLMAASILGFVSVLSMMGCDSESTTSMTFDGGSEADRASGTFEHCENYPDFNLVMAYGDVVPPIGWPGAYLADGTQHDFSFEQFFCGEEFAHKQSLILVIGAGWCPACSRLVETYINPIAEQLTAHLGAELVYLQIQDAQRVPSDNEMAYRHFLRLIGDGPGWRVGDQETMIRDGEDMVPAARFISRQFNLPVLPAVWVIRKRDMRIIATRELAWRSRPGELPLDLIAMDPEQDWSDPPLPPFQNQCRDGDEEETGETTNNSVGDATVIEVGVHSGGICDSEPDFYAIPIDGPWRVRLEYDIRQGDLDLVLWDRQSNVAALDDDGRIIGSFTAENVETLTGGGPAFVQVRGYGGASAPYTITLENR